MFFVRCPSTFPQTKDLSNAGDIVKQFGWKHAKQTEIVSEDLFALDIIIW